MAKTATAAALDLAKERLLALYTEQLILRPKPAGRSEDSWQSIIGTAQQSFENRLAGIHGVSELFQFAKRCLKNPNLKEAFEHHTIEESAEEALPFEVQSAFVNSATEHHNLDRDLSCLPVFNRQLQPAVVIDLDPSPVFSASLNPGSGPIDLD